MSTLPPECEQLLISGYVLGNLSPAEGLLFAEMVRENPELMEQVTVMQQALDSAYNPPELDPPDTLRDRILATANAQTNDDNAVKLVSNEIPTTSPKSNLSKIIGAIALIAITILSVANYRLWRTVKTVKTDPDLAHSQNSNTYLLKGKDLPATAKLIVHRNQLNASLIVQNLPTLPPEKVYALWTVVGKDVPYTTDEKGAILTAVFQVDEAGDFTQEIAVPQPHLEPRTINKVAITVENQSAPQAHTGSIFISTEDRKLDELMIN